LKRIVIFITIFSGFTFNQHVVANTSEVKLKKKCIQQYPWMEGESDLALRGIYAQICDKKNRQNKNNSKYCIDGCAIYGKYANGIFSD
jgi:hypothetical protein